MFCWTVFGIGSERPPNRAALFPLLRISEKDMPFWKRAKGNLNHLAHVLEIARPNLDRVHLIRGLDRNDSATDSATYT